MAGVRHPRPRNLELLESFFRGLNESAGINLTILYDPFDRARFWAGLLMTVYLAATSVVASVMLGILGAAAQKSPFAALRLRTAAAKRFKKVTNATAIIWKLLLVAEKSFRRLNAPELLREVYLGVPFVDGVRRTKQETKTKAAA